MRGQMNFLTHFLHICFLSYILHPARVTDQSQTIFDNIFSNYVSKAGVSDNLTSTTSGHLSQVLFVPSMFSYYNALLQKLPYLKEAGQTSIKLDFHGLL